jgi:hypothetical protein
MNIANQGPGTFTIAFFTTKTGRIMSDFMIIQTVYTLTNIVISSNTNIQAAVKKSIPHSVLPTTLL